MDACPSQLEEGGASSSPSHGGLFVLLRFCKRLHSVVLLYFWSVEIGYVIFEGSYIFVLLFTKYLVVMCLRRVFSNYAFFMFLESEVALTLSNCMILSNLLYMPEPIIG